MAIRKRKGSLETTIQWAMGIMFSPTVRNARWSGKYCMLQETDWLEGWFDKGFSLDEGDDEVA
jgi:hypothetical protein